MNIGLLNRINKRWIGLLENCRLMLLIYSLVYFYYGNLCKAEVVNSAPHSLKVGSGRNDIESSVGFNSNSNHVNLEAIDGTPNYRIYGGKKMNN